MRIQLSAQRLAQLQQAFRLAPQQAVRSLMRAMVEATRLLQREVQDSLAKRSRSGLTLGSVVADAWAVPAGVLGVVGSNQPSAAFLEFGTKPHMPPVTALEQWVQDALGVSAADAHRVAFLVARKIAREGTPALKIFENAFSRNAGQVIAIFDREVGRMADGFLGGPGGAGVPA